jgi:excinuclease UvrABC nuclease subunit
MSKRKLKKEGFESIGMWPEVRYPANLVQRPKAGEGVEMVYCFIDVDEIVYIGKTVGLYSRFSNYQAIRSTPDGDHCTDKRVGALLRETRVEVFIKIIGPQKDSQATRALKYEKELIKTLNPKWNKK